MSNDQVINKQLNNDYEKFYESKYDGKLSIPKGIIDMFKRAIISMPPFAHKINFYKVSSISNKDTKDLTFGDLHEIVKVTLNTPLQTLYPEITESEEKYKSVIKEHIIFEKFVMEYNLIIEDFKQKLSMKKKTLEDLSGKNNGKLSYINNAQA